MIKNIAKIGVIGALIAFFGMAGFAQEEPETGDDEVIAACVPTGELTEDTSIVTGSTVWSIEVRPKAYVSGKIAALMVVLKGTRYTAGTVTDSCGTVVSDAQFESSYLPIVHTIPENERSATMTQTEMDTIGAAVIAANETEYKAEVDANIEIKLNLPR